MKFRPALFIALTVLFTGAANATENFKTAGGASGIAFNEQLLRAYGLQIQLLDQPTGTQDASLEFSAPAGMLRRFVGGTAPPLRLRLDNGKNQRTIQLVGTPQSRALEILWHDEQGALWLRFEHFHSKLDLQSKRFSLSHSDVLIGPALAKYLGQPRLEGQYLGAGTLDSAITASPQRLAPSQCANPIWPTATLRADVALTDLFGLFQMRCDGCDGPGNFNGQLVAAPSALLKNVGLTDVPWYAKFSGVFPPYGNDQHPLLVWAMYRQDGAGVLRQIGRSGIKHAFFTINADCDCADGQILGMNCVDLYSASTNDTPNDGECQDPFSCHQGPRREVIPSTVQWGRCGSIYDGNCDGDPSDFQRYTAFEHRMVVPETAFAAAPGARWRYEGWYLVRDDGNWRNNLGHREVVPSWTPTGGGGVWQFNNNQGAFQNGTAFEAWYREAAAGTIQSLRLLDTPEGKLQIATRVTPVGNLWRYAVSIYNIDFARASISGGEPNLRVLANSGIVQIELPLPASATLSDVELIDSDHNPANDWSHVRVGDSLLFNTDTNNSLDWGALHSFVFTTNLPPASNVLTLRPSTGTPATYSAVALTPGGANVFKDGFE